MQYKFEAVYLMVLLSFMLIACSGNEGSTSQVSTADRPSSPDSLTTHPELVAYSSTAVTGATVYIPVYSHIYQQNAQRTFNLTATLSIRNTDLRSPITITKVYYYDSKGQLVQKYLDTPKEIVPLSSISYVVEEDDLRGGVGANFLVVWEAEEPINQPIMESVMISAAQNQGISFVSVGRVIHSLDSNAP